MKYFSTLFS